MPRPWRWRRNDRVHRSAWAKEERILQITSPREITSLELADTSYHFRRLRVAETLVTIDPDGKLAPELAKAGL